MDLAERGLIFGKRRQSREPSTIAQDRARINRHIAPLLGRKPVRELVSADVAKFLRDVTAGRTAVVEKTVLRGKAVVTGGAGTAARAYSLLAAILERGLREGLLERNVARGVARAPDRKRTRRLSPDEYGVFGRAIREAEQAGNCGKPSLAPA